MDGISLGLELSPRIHGAAAKKLQVGVVRSLTPEDLPLLSMDRKSGAAEYSLKRLSQRHHSLARLIATGTKPEDAAAIMSYELATVYRISVDPAFKELVNFYQRDLDVQMRNNFDRLVGVAADALDELQTRLEEEPEKFSNGQLMEVAKMGADRSGNGPSSSSVTVSINMNIADRMKAAREAARMASDPKLIEQTVNSREPGE